MSALPKNNRSSRRQIRIQDVRDGILMLPDNNYRVILAASSLNFELKSEDEQDAIIDAFKSFLNSLPCPVQLLVRTRELDVARYLDGFRELEGAESEGVYRAQIAGYRAFVQSLVSNNKILARRFYVVVGRTATDKESFEAAGEQLITDADIVAKGLSRLGIQTHRLTSLEVLNLFYSFYSPDGAKRQPLTPLIMQTLRDGYL